MKYVFILVAMAVTACTEQPRTGKTPLEQFKEIDSALGAGSKDVLTTADSSADSRQAALMAQRIYGLIDSLKQMLDNKPDDDLRIAWQLMNDPGYGERLYMEMQQLDFFIARRQAQTADVTTMKSGPLDSTSTGQYSKETAAAWVKMYFYNTPPVAATTILSKFRNDVSNRLYYFRRP